MKEAGWFKYVKGFVFGRTEHLQSNYDIPIQDAIKISLNDFNVPIILDADFGHKPPMMTIINGAIGRFFSSKGKGTLEMKLK